MLQIYLDKITAFILANPEWCAIFIATLIMEFWLGKTKRVGSNSTVELIWNILKAILRRKP